MKSFRTALPRKAFDDPSYWPDGRKPK
ncbi:protein of unknown function [Streptomyces murinus]